TTAVQQKLTVNQLQQVAVLAPLAQSERHGYKLEKLHREDFTAHQKSAVALTQFGQQFQQRESQVFATGGNRVAAGPQVINLDKGDPNGAPPGKVKKTPSPPPFPGHVDGDGGHKGGKPKKDKDK